MNIRAINPNEYPFLDGFLYDAIFIPEGITPPDRSIIHHPELQKYIAHFGREEDDYCLVAEVDGALVGAVWVRIINDYGHVDDDTPSLSISVPLPPKRHRHSPNASDAHPAQNQRLQASIAVGTKSQLWPQAVLKVRFSDSQDQRRR